MVISLPHFFFLFFFFFFLFFFFCNSLCVECHCTRDVQQTNIKSHQANVFFSVGLAYVFLHVWLHVVCSHKFMPYFTRYISRYETVAFIDLSRNYISLRNQCSTKNKERMSIMHIMWLGEWLDTHLWPTNCKVYIIFLAKWRRCLIEQSVFKSWCMASTFFFFFVYI